MRIATGSLWRQRRFRTLWAAYSVSMVGSQVTLLALPLTAVLALHASAAQMGLLTAAGAAPHLFVSLFAGVFVDRRRRRPIMVAADAGRAALLLSVPATAALGALSLGQLYGVALLTETLSVFYTVASSSLLPALAGRERLLEANGKLTASFSAAQVGGPGLAGVLIQLVTAPFAIVADAGSFVFSALSLGFGLRGVEPAAVRREGGASVWREIGAGLRFVLGNPLLRATACFTSTLNFWHTVIFTVLVLYATNELGIGPALLGLILATGAVGALGGALLAGRIARRIGVGKATAWGGTITALACLCYPLAGGPRPLAVAVLLAGELLTGFAVVNLDINQVSLRQALTPERMLGRTGASGRFITWGVRPFGALLAGWLGTAFGLRATLAIGAGGGLLAVLWLWLSPLPALRILPAEPLAAAPTAERVASPAA
ncbi:MAG TPA: MFS transporter [Dehalococcoidia bacterium]|nr:MFS transporter [Dehalococcoidia bacterium]